MEACPKKHLQQIFLIKVIEDDIYDKVLEILKGSEVRVT